MPHIKGGEILGSDEQVILRVAGLRSYHQVKE